MCYCSTNTGVEQIPKQEPAQKVDPGEKFSRRSCRDSNPPPFDHESGALTTELSPLSRNQISFAYSAYSQGSSFFSIVSNFNILKAVTLLVHAGLFWCFHNPQNSDRIFQNVLM